MTFRRTATGRQSCAKFMSADPSTAEPEMLPELSRPSDLSRLVQDCPRQRRAHCHGIFDHQGSGPRCSPPRSASQGKGVSPRPDLLRQSLPSLPGDKHHAAVRSGVARSIRSRSRGLFIPSHRSLRRWKLSQKSRLSPNTRARMSAVGCRAPISAICGRQRNAGSNGSRRRNSRG